MAARTYKRDSNGRFASGSGGSSGGGKSAAKKTAAAKPAAKKPAAAKPVGDGRRGPRGGKTGTRAEQRKAAAAQAARSAEFRGKATAGRGAKDAYKAAARGARISEKGAARKVVAKKTPRRVDTSPAARKRASESNIAAVTRKQKRAADIVSRLQDEQSKLSRDINRRRGAITGENRDAAKRRLKRVTKSLDTARKAVAEYSRADKNARTGPVVPMTARRALARVQTLRRLVSYQRKNELSSYDVFGDRVTGAKEQSARDELKKAISSLAGQRVTFRSVARANRAQRKKAERTLKRSRGRLYVRGTSRQGNLLTGAFSSVASGRLRPVSFYVADALRGRRAGRRVRLK